MKHLVKRYALALGMLGGALPVGRASPALAQDNELTNSSAGLEDLSLVDLMDLDPKVTTATRSVALTLEEAPSTMSLISRDDIDRHGYRTVGEALASVPGLFVVDDLVTSNLAIRGLQAGPDSWSRTFKFMIDSQPVQFQPTGGALLGAEFVPMESVESIEVVRGPASALYGANALLGVINVITRTPQRDGLGATIAVEGAMIRDNPGGTVAGYASWRGGGDRPYWLSAAVQGGWLDRSGLSVPTSSPRAASFGGVRTEGDVSRPLSFSGQAAYDLRQYGRLALHSVYQRLDTHAPVSELSAFDAGTRYAESNFANGLEYRLPLLKSWALGPDWKQTAYARATLGVTHGKSLDAERISSPAGLFHRDRKTTTLEGGVEFGYSLGQNSVLLGLDYQALHDAGEAVFDISRETGIATARNTRVPLDISNIGALAQLMLYPLDRLGLTGSFRIDKNERWGTNATWRGAGVWRIADGLHVKALYGTSYVPPAPSQLGAVPLVLNGGVTGNPDLRSQRGTTVETAILLRLLDNLKVDATAFQTTIHDRVESQLVGQLFRAENLTESKTRGVELAAGWHLDPLSVRADVAYQSTRLAEPAVVNFQWERTYGEDTPGGASPPNFPNLLSHLAVAAEWPALYLGGALTGTYVGQRKSSVANILENGEAYLLDAYFEVNLHLRTLNLQLLRGSATEFSLHVEDLFNTRSSQGGYQGVDIPAVGRSVFFKMTQSL